MADYNLTEHEKELIRWLVENVRAHDYKDEFIFSGAIGQRPAVELYGVEGKFETMESTLRALQDDGFVTLRPDPSGFALHGTLRQKAFDAVDDNFEIQPIIASLVSVEDLELPPPSYIQQVEIRPEKSEFHPIFRGRGFRVEEDLCFVLMPFGPDDLQVVYRDHVKPTVERCDLRCERSDDIYGPNVVIEDIWAGINRARFIIAELTGRNPNVFYEVGLCHVVGKDAIFLAQDINDIPFDLRHFRVILYDYTPRGVKQLEEALERTIKAILQQSE